MIHIVVLFNLKPGVSAEDYEAWAKSTDLPIVRGLSSIEGFELLKMNGILRSEAKPPYQYVEILRVKDMTQFGADVATDQMRTVAGQFRELADNPTFISCSTVE